MVPSKAPDGRHFGPLWTLRNFPGSQPRRTGPQPRRTGPLPIPVCAPQSSYQASQDVGSDEHVEDVVPACGGNEPGQQRPQSRTCVEHSMREGPCTRDPGPPCPQEGSIPRVRPRPGLGRESQTYGSSAVDDGRDGGERLCVALQALVSPLGREQSGEA